METIDQHKTALLIEIFTSGYHKAAASFSALTNHQVTIDELLIDSIHSPEESGFFQTASKNLTVVTTEIIGELRGESHLILTEEEKSRVASMTLTTLGSAKLEENVVCKEIDNIISAAIITELSNALQVSIYGDVPRLYIFETMEILLKRLTDDHKARFISVRSQFRFDGLAEINPWFIWKLDPKIIKHLLA